MIRNKKEKKKDHQSLLGWKSGRVEAARSDVTDANESIMTVECSFTSRHFSMESSWLLSEEVEVREIETQKDKDTDREQEK